MGKAALGYSHYWVSNINCNIAVVVVLVVVVIVVVVVVLIVVVVVVLVVVVVVVVVKRDGKYAEISCKLHDFILSICEDSKQRRMIMLKDKAAV
jgi:Flp pilus assembly protein TadB